MVTRRALFLASLLAGAPAAAESWSVDPARSSLTINVGKTGALSALGDEHQVRAPVKSGTVSDGHEPRVELTFDARKMIVLDPKLAAKKRAEVQTRMLGPDVLDVERFPEIRFRSTAVRAEGADSWRVEGVLELHGKSGPLTLEVKRTEGVFRGAARFRQRAFGMEPVTAAAGTVKVKDELLVEFEIATTPASGNGSGAAPAR